MKRTAIPKISDKQKVELALRARIKRELIEEFGDECMTCRNAHRDWRGISLSHIIPLSRGGQTSKKNCLLECYPCHEKYEKRPELRGKQMKAEETIRNNPQYKEIMFRAYQLFSEGKEYKLTQDNIDTIIEISLKLGEEEERKKWIKEAIKAGILISKPEELAGIITTSLADICLKHRKAGINEAVEWIEGTHDPLTYRPKWQAFKKERGIK